MKGVIQYGWKFCSRFIYNHDILSILLRNNQYEARKHERFSASYYFSYHYSLCILGNSLYIYLILAILFVDLTGLPSKTKNSTLTIIMIPPITWVMTIFSLNI